MIEEDLMGVFHAPTSLVLSEGALGHFEIGRRPGPPRGFRGRGGFRGGRRHHHHHGPRHVVFRDQGFLYPWDDYYEEPAPIIFLVDPLKQKPKDSTSTSVGAGHRNPALVTAAYARKWGDAFEVPPDWLLTIAEIESSHNPKKINMAVASKGGAWGLMQQMYDEAPYKVAILKRFYSKPHPSTENNWRNTPEDMLAIRRTLSKWHGRAQDLLDPDLNMLLATWQVARLRRIFGNDFETVIAAYHQGESAVRERLERGRPAVNPYYQPKGYQYVARASQALPGYGMMLASL